MRRRDLQRLRVPPDWHQRSQEALAAVQAGTKTLTQCSGLWAELKPLLAELSFQKCWYCESRQIRSDNAVDHFRPKSKYLWRAFSYQNFRFTCTFCNSRRTNPGTGETEGKGDFFPLFEEHRRAISEAGIDAEQPILLDPCLAADCGLLDFRADGVPCPMLPDQPNVARRVIESVRYYHLDHPELVEQRRILALRLESLIKDVDRIYPRVIDGGDSAIDRTFESLVEMIARAMEDTEELSAFARRIVKFHKNKPWIDQIL